MSHRVIERDPVQARRKAYEDLESTGESQEALWEAIQVIADSGMSLGPKASAVLAKRGSIKAKNVKT